MALTHHPTSVLPIGDFWCLYPTEFPWSEHHRTFFSVILPNLIPLPSQWPTIPFSPLFFPDNLPFWGKFSLTLLRIHQLSLEFSPFWDIGDLLYVVFHLSHQNTIRMCHLLAFLGDIWLWQLWTPKIHIPYLPLYLYFLGQLDWFISNPRGLTFLISVDCLSSLAALYLSLANWHGPWQNDWVYVIHA